MAKLKVGAAIKNIDWPLEEYPAQSQFVFCEDKYDDCNLRAIALESGDKRLMLLVYELSDIPEVPNLEARVAEAIGYAEEDIIIAVTHNHTSPCDRGCRWAPPEEKQKFREKYMEIELKASIAAAKEACSSLRTAKYGYGEINSYINANELTRNPEVGYLCDENTNGYSDKTLAIMKFVDENDKLICVLMNYCVHCGCGMTPDINGKNATSGNLSGLACRFVEDYFGNGMVAVWTSGAAGNQHPLLDGEWVKRYTDGYMTRKRLPDGSGFMLMEQVGRQHGVDAINGINLITEYTDEVTISHLKKSVMLKNQINTHEWGLKKSNVDDYGDGLRSNQPEPQPPFEAPPMIEDPDHPTELKFELVNFGKMVWVGMGAEPFCQIGRDIKAALPVNTMVITHTPGWCGDNPTAVGYIVDKSSLGSTHGKLFRNLIPGGYDDLIVDTVREMYAKTLESEAGE